MLLHSSEEAYVSLFFLEVNDIYSPSGRGTPLQTASEGGCDVHQFYQFFHLPMHIMLLRWHIVLLTFDRDAD